ncbi:sigma-70 family RNA polymerase sigma factor [Iocasia frigidifontis]|uniref:Sigma-70 family RNA polymerase sigma factor n=1 Tax=Iocasia fonsfrigidae TaxID=2682810 RepID=A0A8A7KGY7_9FIRM|nr:RNA polymerase sigma factor [Iocasia fonsfrigidae]QTL99008.1 sigma-70 family RNA polymerase sigma factor [Iocasia fonsfrigidae]
MPFSQNMLVNKLKEGDKEAYLFFCDNYSSEIYNLAYKMLGNREDAEDITQDTIVQVYCNIKGFKGNSSLYTWVYRITKNLCLKHLQDKKRSSFSSLEKIIYKEQSEKAAKSFSAIEKKFYINQIKEGCLIGLLKCLSFYQRAVFILNVLFDVEIKYLAQILDKSENATRILIHRSKKNIKSFLCRNCFLYNSNNFCKCENLIEFSLKRGWIEESSPDKVDGIPDLSLERIENELMGLKKIIYLYKDLEKNLLMSL